MKFLKNRALVFALFSIMTIGNAYPYVDMYRDLSCHSTCECCLLKKGGCPHCSRFGHRHFGENNRNHQKGSLIDESPCQNPTQKLMVSFVPDPFLIKNFSWSQPFETATLFLSPHPSLKIWSIKPPTPPPKNVS